MERPADDPFQPPSRRRPSTAHRSEASPPPPREPQGDLLKRRLLALVIGVGVLILLLLGLRACLDARKERSFENYLRDLEALVTTSNQLSDEFFKRFRDPGQATELEFQAQLGSSRGTSEDLLDRAEGLDTPDQLGDAQSDLELAFELRRDAVGTIVEEIEVALGEEGSQAAYEEIARDMREFLASDVLYDRAREEIERVLAEEEIGGEVPTSMFLPEPIEPWLDRLEIARLLAQVAGETGAADGGTRGTELGTVSLSPGNVPLTPDTLNTIGRTPDKIEVTVLNGGIQDETDVLVAYELLGSAEPVEGETMIPRIRPAESASGVIPVTGEISPDEELTLVVTVLPVPGESIVDNNELAFQVVFE